MNYYSFRIFHVWYSHRVNDTHFMTNLGSLIYVLSFGKIYVLNQFCEKSIKSLQDPNLFHKKRLTVIVSLFFVTSSAESSNLLSDLNELNYF